MSSEIDDIVSAYENGLPGWQFDERTMDNLFADDLVGTFDEECPHLAGYGAGKRAMLWRSRDLYDPGAFGQEKQTTGDCFVAGTPVLGPTTKPIERVRVGDAVWSGNGKLTTVVSTRCISTRKPLLRISLHGMLPIVCTPDHKLCACYALAGASEVETKLVPACELNVGDRLHLPDTFALPTAEWPEWLHDTPDVRWLVGALLGNGYVGQGMIELWSAKPHVLERAAEALLSLRISAIRRTSRRGATRIRACCQWLAALLRAELYDGKQKTAKPWMYRAEVVEGLLDTDGTSDGDRRMFDNTAPALTWLVYVMIHHSGYRPCVIRLARIAGTYANAKPIYRVHWLAREWRKDYWQGGARIRRIDVLATSEPVTVYDIGVADATHTFAAGGVAVSNCVSHGSRNARDTTRSVEIHIKGEPEEYFKRGATEPTYGARGHGGQGMDPARAARFEVEYGFLFRQNYPGVVDLSVYNSSIGSRWGSTGVPEAVKELCKQHNVGRWIAPRTPEQARDLLAAGYAIHSGQSWGCKAVSDSRGIAITSGAWNHDMATVGVDDTKEIYPVTVFLVVNSWGCLSEDTEILTRGGWMRFPDLLGIEEVATLKPGTLELEWQRIQQIHRYEYDGYLLKFAGQGVDLLVTPNHRMYVRTHTQPDSRWRFVAAEDCSPCVRMAKRCAWSGGRELETYQVGEYSVPGDAWLEFLGWWLSEGNVVVRRRAYVVAGQSRQTRPCYQVAICQAKRDNMALIDRLVARLPWRMQRYERGGAVTWVTCDQAVGKELEQFGRQPVRYLPDYVFDLPVRQQKLLLRALMLGDGSAARGKTRYYTSSRRLADDVQRLAIMAGYAADVYSVDRRGARDSRGRRYVEMEYIVAIKSSRTTPMPRHGWRPILVPYTGHVWCVTTPNGVIMVRRNGRAVWTGNSWNQKPRVWPDDLLGPWPPGSFWVDIDTYGRYFVGSRSIFAYCDIKGVPAKKLPDWGKLDHVLG